MFQSRTDAQPLIQEILKEDEVCIQELIRGREFTVSLSSLNNDIQVLGIMEILTQKEFFDYDAKYSLDQTEEIFLSGESDLEQQLSQSAKQIFSAVGCKDVARIDFLYSQGTLYFLEVNTIP
ncbi:MAG: ATP-grasp domain-containing protein [Candidatus Peribacteria bacterium]|nr:ATP-grasp domain-containing protein [Candidatus Peribacteria bacterium]